LAMRNLARRPFRSLGTSLGVASALVLVLLNGEVLEGMRLAMHTQFELAQRYDLRADLVMPLPARSLEKRLQSSGAIEQVESILSMPTRLAGPNGYRDTFLQGLEPEGTLLRSVDFDGQVVMPSPGGVVISRNLAGELGLAVGDEVVLSQPDLERETAVRIDDLADVALGHSVVMQLADAQSAFGLVGWTNTVLVNAKPGQIGDARGAMQDLPGVMRMQDLLGFRDQLNRYMALAWTVLGVMMLFSVLLASAILYNTASMAILERKRELATLRTLGHSFGRIIAMVTVENGVMAVLGFLMGVPLSIVSIRYALTLYSSDMFAIPFVFSPMTVAMVGVGSLVVLFLAQAPALRRIASTSLAETVRSREG